MIHESKSYDKTTHVKLEESHNEETRNQKIIIGTLKSYNN